MQNLYHYPYLQNHTVHYPFDACHHSPFAHPSSYLSYPIYRAMPAVNPHTFMNSARQSGDLLKDAQTVSEGLYKSHSFSKKIMEAAQQSNTDLVKNLLTSLPIRNHYELTYNPDGIRITFSPKNQTNTCCTVILSLKWQEFV